MCMMNPTGIRVFCNIDIDIQNTNFRWCFERSNRIWCVAIRIEWPLVDIQMWILDNRGKRAKKNRSRISIFKEDCKMAKTNCGVISYSGPDSIFKVCLLSNFGRTVEHKWKSYFMMLEVVCFGFLLWKKLFSQEDPGSWTSIFFLFDKQITSSLEHIFCQLSSSWQHSVIQTKPYDGYVRTTLICSTRTFRIKYSHTLNLRPSDF